MVGPSLRDPLTEWQALHAMRVKTSSPFDSGEFAGNVSDLFDLLHPTIKMEDIRKMIRNLICKEIIRKEYVVSYSYL
tara:strand:+ start:87 stop:317 length:231 start_codon:yes stop_codon:yes gene_type:complete